MRLYKNSIAFRLIDDIRWLGNLPYSALRLYPYDYESTKDAVQKLMRAGYVGVVKARNIKSLYATPAGLTAFSAANKRCGNEETERCGITYCPKKVERVDKLNETMLLFIMARYLPNEKYIDSREFKREMEEDDPRAADSLKYSRFAGFWYTEKLGMMVYHFGGKNIHLNQNGELSAKFKLMESIGRNPLDILPMLIFGDTMDTMLSILRYSEWWYNMPKWRRKRLKNVHYYLDTDSEMLDYTYFLPMNRLAIPILHMMYSKSWDRKFEDIYQLCQKRHGQNFALALGCHLKSLMLQHIFYESERGEKITIVCYDWQQESIERYYREIADHKEIWLEVCDTKAVEDFFWERTNELAYKALKLERQG